MKKLKISLHQMNIRDLH